MTDDSRFKRGLEKLYEVDGSTGIGITENLGDLGKYIVEFAFGDVYSREGLSLREREIATIAMLTCLGGREPQLNVHIHAGLNVGLTRQEMEEIIIQTVPYAGFPTAINAMNLLKTICVEKQTTHAEENTISE